VKISVKQNSQISLFTCLSVQTYESLQVLHLWRSFYWIRNQNVNVKKIIEPKHEEGYFIGERLLYGRFLISFLDIWNVVPLLMNLENEYVVIYATLIIL